MGPRKRKTRRTPERKRNGKQKQSKTSEIAVRRKLCTPRESQFTTKSNLCLGTSSVFAQYLFKHAKNSGISASTLQRQEKEKTESYQWKTD